MKKFLAALLLVSMVGFVGCKEEAGPDTAVEEGKEAGADAAAKAKAAADEAAAKAKKLTE